MLSVLFVVSRDRLARVERNASPEKLFRFKLAPPDRYARPLDGSKPSSLLLQQGGIMIVSICELVECLGVKPRW